MNEKRKKKKKKKNPVGSGLFKRGSKSEIRSSSHWFLRRVRVFSQGSSVKNFLVIFFQERREVKKRKKKGNRKGKREI